MNTTIVAAVMLWLTALISGVYDSAHMGDPIRLCYVESSKNWGCYLPADAPLSTLPVYVGPESGIHKAWVSSVKP